MDRKRGRAGSCQEQTRMVFITFCAVGVYVREKDGQNRFVSGADITSCARKLKRRVFITFCAAGACEREMGRKSP